MSALVHNVGDLIAFFSTIVIVKFNLAGYLIIE